VFAGCIYSAGCAGKLLELGKGLRPSATGFVLTSVWKDWDEG